MMKKLPVSACFVSGAEAHRIGKALASVSGWVSEIIVLLNEEVKDGTEEIALSHGAKIFREPWKGFLSQKNSAMQKVRQPWILSLDADEEVTPSLREEIESTLDNPAKTETFAAFEFPRCTYFCGRWIRHGDWYPDRVLRLWKNGSAIWAGIDPHPRLEVNGRVGRLHGDLLHFSNESIDHRIGKIVSYSNDFARHLQAQGRGLNAFDLFVRPFWRFVRAYFFRLGFMDGWQGYYIARWTAFYTLTRYVKIRENNAPEESALGKNTSK